ncbi:MFS transporter [Actinokineospora pegani]|uniref:hypothetical protein n=1 Tax=Actinokineospora pegani TaxID=2654637 RepID=UPI0012EA4F71|nr:hypothetical protein [Actinokineospora pegani]
MPAAAALGALRIEHLVAVGFLLGTFTVLFEVSWQSYVPELLPPDLLTDGNSRIATTNAVAAVPGPSLAVLLAPALGAWLAVGWVFFSPLRGLRDLPAPAGRA